MRSETGLLALSPKRLAGAALKGVQRSLFALAIGAVVLGTGLARSQSAAAPAANSVPHQTGTVKSTGSGSLVISTKDGQDVIVSVGDSAKVLIVPPGSTSLSSATPGTVGDIQPGDRALVTGSTGDSSTSLTAVRVVVMKSAALAQVHAAQSSAWAQGIGGIVKSVSGNSVVISSGMKTVTVETTPQTIVRRYSDGSVKFEDAVTSTVAAIRPGDQLRVRGAKSPDGTSVTADEIVTGAFHNYSGVIASIDGQAGTVTLKDLASKKTVTVTVTANSDVRRLPSQAAAMIAMRMRGDSGAGAAGARPAGAPGGDAGGNDAGQRRAGAAGSDLSRMLSRLPTETVDGLKPGEAVMIVASTPAEEAVKPTAITLLAGVEPILAAPAGQTTVLSPWSIGGGGEGEAGGGGAQ